MFICHHQIELYSLRLRKPKFVNMLLEQSRVDCRLHSSADCPRSVDEVTGGRNICGKEFTVVFLTVDKARKERRKEMMVDWRPGQEQWVMEDDPVEEGRSVACVLCSKVISRGQQVYQVSH